MLSDEEFRRLLDALDRPWAGFRKIRKGVKKRVRRHMEQHGCTTIDAYLELLEKNPTFRNECEVCLRVIISRFYRDRRLWEHLEKHVLPELLDRFPKGLTAWSAGCANGEEPYSLAIVWETLTAFGMPSPLLRILATDADAECLKRAETGRYPLSSLKEVPDAMKSRWFRKVPGSHQWQIDPLLKKYIDWQAHDLLAPPPDNAFNLILLRNNLLTYYQGDVLQIALKGITQAIVPGGILILGSHEQLPSGLPFSRAADCPWTYHARNA